jgi:hypothetical protein
LLKNFSARERCQTGCNISTSSYMPSLLSKLREKWWPVLAISHVRMADDGPETVSKTLDYNASLTQLIAWEDFIVLRDLSQIKHYLEKRIVSCYVCLYTVVYFRLYLVVVVSPVCAPMKFVNKLMLYCLINFMEAGEFQLCCKLGWDNSMKHRSQRVWSVAVNGRLSVMILASI